MPWATTAVVPTAAAVRPTGPSTPRRPMRRAASMSVSLFLIGGLVERHVGLQRGDQRLDRNPAVGHQLAAGPADRGGERCGPEVLVHQQRGARTGFERVGDARDVLLAEQVGELTFQFTDLAQRPGVGIAELERL